MNLKSIRQETEMIVTDLESEIHYLSDREVFFYIEN